MTKTDNKLRIKLILTGLFGLLLLSGCLIDQIGGAFSNPPEDLERNASKATRELIERAYEGIDPTRIVDHHLHVLAVGTSAADAFVNPRMRHGLNLERLKFQVYASASGIKHIDDADREYVERLARLIRALKYHGKYRILAFDKHYHADGAVDLGKTNMYVPNRYVVELANKYPDIFTPVISVHPYRTDALQELEKWAQAGVKYVKWLPNAMGMDPANPSIDPFYFMMKKYRMILLSHTGEEQAVEAEEDQRLGNPLLLRRPLDLGVRVIMAHSASLGTCDTVDNGLAKKESCFDLFLRLMDEPKYVGLLFGEISAITQYNRMPTPLATLLSRQDLHPRLVNGSDYPLPAINALIRTTSLASNDFITTGERQSLNEIYDHNPLLFDFVLKRTLRHPKTRQKLAASIFMANPGLEN
ncbi:MAG TPA: amidohydrolase family protein [Candidatus Saccharimonadales bacterium]|nr:amidohydrolase family protein [Candidatus Saccharimonadales bacterium]